MMDSKDVSNTSRNTSSHGSINTNLTAKMRRLRIQEDLLIQSIKKSIPDSENNFIKSDLEFKKYVSGLKKSYADIKRLLDDVKCTTKSQDILENLDIDEVKKDVLELDHKIKAFKTYLQKELTELKNSEKELLKQLDDDTVQNHKAKKITKVTTKSYSDIIPSPVKNLINSPLKSPEVQQFQDFICSSNKHGGWNEYNHNIFVRIWQKHFECDADSIDTENMDYIDKDSFVDEVIEKISGVRRNDVLAHMKWYSKYLYLKKRQRIALDEWRAKTKPKKVRQSSEHGTSQKKSNKIFNAPPTKGKRSRRNSAKCGGRSLNVEYYSDISTGYSPISDEDNFYNCVDANEFFKEMDEVRKCHKSLHNDQASIKFKFTKPTKQWENRCNSKSDLQSFNRNLEDINKLGVPTWRLGLAWEE